MNKLIVFVILVAAFVAAAIATGLSAGSDSSFATAEEGRGTVVQDFDASEEEEVVMEYNEIQEDEETLGSLRTLPKFSFPNAFINGGNTVPVGGVKLVGNKCQVDCAAFYSSTETAPICRNCRKFVQYDKPANRGCYIHPQDFENGQVSQTMIDSVYNLCNTRTICAQCLARPILANIGLFQSMRGNQYYGTQSPPMSYNPNQAASARSNPGSNSGYMSTGTSSGSTSTGGMGRVGGGIGTGTGGGIGGSVILPNRPNGPIGPNPLAGRTGGFNTGNLNMGSLGARLEEASAEESN